MSCVYCIGDRNDWVKSLDKNGHVAVIDNKLPHLLISYHGHQMSVPIKYCPMCGRELKE